MKYRLFFLSVILGISLLMIVGCHRSETTPKTKVQPAEETVFPSLTREMARNFSRLAFTCIQKEYPNKLSHVMNDSTEVQSPKSLHPVFFGCFDWHSCVHGHWMLVRLLKTFPDLSGADSIRTVLSMHFTRENIQKEVAYLHKPNRKSFERTYGWAWLLKLSEELNTWNDPEGRVWARNLKPLSDAFVQRYLDFLPVQAYPIRRGVHPNTAFGLIFALDYARQSGRKDLEDMIIQRSMAYYLHDHDAPARWEPDGDDFLSPSLEEADLMLRILPKKKFARWFHAFLPDLAEDKPENLLHPPAVTDRSDPKIVHLDGLDLSRAWCMMEIASGLPENDPYVAVLKKAAVRHANATLPYISGGNYEGEHWLASFAVYMLIRDKSRF